MQVLRGDPVVQVRDNVSSPLVLERTRSGVQPTGSRCGRATSRAAATGRRPVTPIVPSGVPGAPSNLRRQFVYDAGQRGIACPGDRRPTPAAKPVQSYRVLLEQQRVRSPAAAISGRTFVRLTTGMTPVSVSVIARNSRGAGPAAATDRWRRSARPSQVDRAGAGRRGRLADSAPGTRPARPAVRSTHYDYRVNGGGWTSAGSGDRRRPSRSAGQRADLSGRGPGL